MTAFAAWFEDGNKSTAAGSRSAVIFPEMTALQPSRRRRLSSMARSRFPCARCFPSMICCSAFTERQAASKARRNAHPFDRFPPAYQCRRQIQNCLPLRQRRRLFEAGAFVADAKACFCSDDLDSPGSIDKLHWPSAFPSDLASSRACSSMAAVYDGRRSEVYNRSDERSKLIGIVLDRSNRKG